MSGGTPMLSPHSRLPKWREGTPIAQWSHPKASADWAIAVADEMLLAYRFRSGNAPHPVTIESQYTLRCLLENLVTDIETNRKLALEVNDLAMCESRNLEAYVKGIIRRFDEDGITTKVEDLEEIATKTRKADEAASLCIQRPEDAIQCLL